MGGSVIGSGSSKDMGKSCGWKCECEWELGRVWVKAVVVGVSGSGSSKGYM